MHQPVCHPEAQAQQQLEVSAGGHIGRALEPAIEPLGFDWKIGVGLVASLAAREVIVATLAQIYAVGDPDDFDGLRGALRSDINPNTGQPVFNIAVALSLLVFFVFALQCTSTIVVMAKGNRVVEMARVRVQLHAGSRLRRELHHLPGRFRLAALTPVAGGFGFMVQ